MRALSSTTGNQQTLELTLREQPNQIPVSPPNSQNPCFLLKFHSLAINVLLDCGLEFALAQAEPSPADFNDSVKQEGDVDVSVFSKLTFTTNLDVDAVSDLTW